MIGIGSGKNDLGIDVVGPVNWHHPLNRDLAAWWLATPGTGAGVVWNDLTNSHPGTLTNMHPPSDWVGPLGRRGGSGSLDFDGSDDFVDIGDYARLAQSAMSVSLWVRPGVVNSANGALINKGYAFFQNTGFAMYLWDTGSIYMDFGYGAGVTQIGLGTSLHSPGQWIHLAFSSRAGAHNCYLNGKYKAGSTSSNTIAANNHSVGIGKFTTNFAKNLLGQMDDVRIWTRALSATEVEAVYQESLRGYPETIRRVRLPMVAPAAVSATSYLMMLGVG